MAKFNPNFFTQFFEKPRVSIFSRKKQVDTDINIGPLYPMYWDFTGFGDSHKGYSLHKMRLAPLLAPNFTDLKFQEHSAVVPLRVLMKDYEARFNYAKNPEGMPLPTISLEEILSIYKKMGEYGISPIGSLFDFLGYPVFADLYKSIMADFPDFYILLDTSAPESRVPWSYFYTANDIRSSMGNDNTFPMMLVNYTYRRYYPQGGLSVIPFFAWMLLRAFPGVYYRYNGGFLNISNNMSRNYDVASFLDSHFDSDSGNLDTISLFKACGFDTTSSAYIAYQNYVFTSILTDDFANNYFDDHILENAKSYTLLPLMAYHRFVADWNINSLITDPDHYLDYYVFNCYDNLVGRIGQIPEENFRRFVTPAPRLWDNDFFTSLLPTSSAGDELTIPANATVIDLAKLASWQKLLLRISFSKRYRDVIYNIFGVKPSDARLQQSSVIRSFTHNIGIGETIQTSETTASNVLGSFSGRGYSAGSSQKKTYHIYCEEPCVVLHFASLVPGSSYADAVHPLINVDDILDFPLPGTDVLGNQPITADLLSGNPYDQESILGFGRQYLEWICTYDTVHNNMKTSLDYWQLSRRFSETPALNEDFLTINEADDMDNLFSVADSTHAFLSILYDCKVTRPIHRTVRILI